jgi:uncharacterized protein
MYPRFQTQSFNEALKQSSAVLLLGPRQIGKTTLAHGLLESHNAVYLDLESPEDLARLANPVAYLRAQQDRLVILDEVQRMPALFESLRGLIDAARRAGKRSASYVLLGSASLDLLRQSSESLAGRLRLLELHPLHRLEVPDAQWSDLWLRGGFPESLIASDLQASIQWRRDFIRTYLERDIPQFAPRVAAEALRRFWVMLAHLQGTTVNLAQLARNLLIDTRTANNYLDLLVDLMLVRRLQPWSDNAGKRLVRSPKIFIRDSGLVHSLLGITDMDSLLSHPVVGNSWEGHVLESLLSVLPDGVSPSFYRTSAGAEIDLLLTWPNGEQWAIEVKRSTTPKLERGFYSACEDLKPVKKWLIYSGSEAYPLGNDVEVLPLEVAMQRLANQTGVVNAS